MCLYNATVSLELETLKYSEGICSFSVSIFFACSHHHGAKHCERHVRLKTVMTEEEKMFSSASFFFTFSLPFGQLNGIFNLNVLKLGIKVGKACFSEELFLSGNS